MIQCCETSASWSAVLKYSTTPDNSSKERMFVLVLKTALEEDKLGTKCASSERIGARRVATRVGFQWRRIEYYSSRRSPGYLSNHSSTSQRTRPALDETTDMENVPGKGHKVSR